MQELEIGAKIKYHDEESGKWLQGTVHGVRKVDDVDGVPRVLTYLVDTGKDEHTSVLRRDLRHEFTSREMNKLVAADKSSADHITKVQKARDKVMAMNLPKTEIVEDVVRQPEQIDVRPEHVKPH